jgi:SlyX protein
MSDIPKLTARIDELEIHLAHQDQTIEDLNESLSRQWTEIENLTRQLAKLGDRINIVEEHGGEPMPAEPPPPHY